MSQGHLFQCLTTFSQKHFFLTFKWNLLYFNLCPCAPCPFTENTLAPSSLLPPQVFIDIDQIPSELSLLLAEQPQISQPLPVHQMLQSLHQLRGPSLPLIQCLPYTGDPRPGPSTPDVSHQGSAERKDHLLQPASNALPNATRSSLQWGCTAGSCLNARVPRAFPAKLLSSQSPTCIATNSIPLQVRSFAFFFLNFMTFLSADFSFNLFNLLWFMIF